MGFAHVVFGTLAVMVAVLSIGAGFEKTLATTGSDASVIVLRGGTDTEMNSGLSLESTRIIADAPGFARAGGLALGIGVASTGLDVWLIDLVDWEAMPSWLVAALLGLLALVMSTVISNSAAANLLVPIGLTLATSPALGLDPIRVGFFIAIGASLAINEIGLGDGHSVKAYIDDSRVEALTEVEVSA